MSTNRSSGADTNFPIPDEAAAHGLADVLIDTMVVLARLAKPIFGTGAEKDEINSARENSVTTICRGGREEGRMRKSGGRPATRPNPCWLSALPADWP
jgi:hypothetical protein